MKVTETKLKEAFIVASLDPLAPDADLLCNLTSGKVF
jgi:hypothetical protein